MSGGWGSSVMLAACCLLAITSPAPMCGLCALWSAISSELNNAQLPATSSSKLPKKTKVEQGRDIMHKLNLKLYKSLKVISYAYSCKSYVIRISYSVIAAVIN